MGGPRQAWGWHQLDPSWAQRLVEDAGVCAGDLVLDIGAGLGAITDPLLTAGARVVAVEAHPGRAAQLRERYGDRAVVVRADAADLRLPRRPFHVVANPPYAITSALMRRLLHRGSRLLSAHLVLQEHAAQRWVGPQAPAAGRWQQVFEPKLGPRLPRRAFRPPPKVPSRVLSLQRRTHPPRPRR